MQERRSSRPSTMFDQLRMSKEKSIVNHFMKNRDVPDWYRGMSTFQLNAANSLHNALRDDTEQGTTHRVLDVLSTIGIIPLVSGKDIRLLMNLSRGNDLAFLWFLNDIHYKTKGDDYCLNEQLIMSSIAHLDLRFTLRGLHEILPPEQPSKREVMRKRASKKQQKAKVPKLGKRQDIRPNSIASFAYSTFKTRYKLPYFQKQNRPRPYGKPLHASPPEYTLKMRFGDIMDSDHNIPNESNRWFASYDISDSKRLASCIIRENLIPTVFSGQPKREEPRLLKPSDLLSSDPIAQATIFDRHIFDNIVLPDETDTTAPLVSSPSIQQKLKDEEQKMKAHESKVLARDRYLQYFDVTRKKKKECVERIRKDIERDVSLHMDLLKREINKSREGSYMKLWTKDDICDCDPVAVNKENIHPPNQRKRDVCKPSKDYFKFDEYGLSVDEKKSKQKLQQPHSPLGDITQRHSILKNNTKACKKNLDACIGDSIKIGNKMESDPKKDAVRLAEKQRKAARLQSIMRGDQPDSGYEYLKSYDYGHMEQQLSEENDKQEEDEVFFTAPVENAPYNFDYQKIFTFDDAPKKEDTLKQKIMKVLNSQLGLESDNNEKPHSDTIDGAVKAYAIKTFKEKTREYNEREAEEERKRKQKKRSSLSIDLDYYDPEDDQLMHTMLKEGLQMLARDPKYVLASMPDSEKFPFFIYWMYWRYGRNFSQPQLAAMFRKSMPVLHALNRMTINVLLPSARSLGPALFVDYSCRDYLMKKTQRIRESYYRYLDAAIMDQSRCLYLTMNPHLCISGTPNNTYFAYMPARVSDIQHFHVWRPTEYMHAKEEHHKRLCKARRDF